MVEIGYSIVEAFHRRGIASAAMAQLVDRAFADPRVEVVTAETPVTFTASRGLLEKCGFTLTGTRTDPRTASSRSTSRTRAEDLRSLTPFLHHPPLRHPAVSSGPHPQKARISATLRPS